ncbi:hypothetical protein BH11BAC1_BH11BAC1_23140 [soil metagenome]
MLTKYSKSTFFKYPFAMMQFAAGNKMPLHHAMLMDSARKLLGNRFNEGEAKIYIDEITNKDFIRMNEVQGFKVVGNQPTHFFGKFLYFILRCLKPEIVVESGVSHGASSWNILNALHKNKKGTLYSIDLPDKDGIRLFNVTNFKKEIGWVVPDVLRDRWQLQLGDAKKLLPELLRKLGAIDVFFHDSDHSYDFMTFEFNEAYPFLKNGGLVISDDVHLHGAFEEFVDQKNMIAIKFNAKGGAALK